MKQTSIGGNCWQWTTIFMTKKPIKQNNKKEFGVIGLGRMGGDLALLAIEKGWRVVG